MSKDVRDAQRLADQLDEESDRLEAEMRSLAAQLDDFQRQTEQENLKVEEVTQGVSDAKSVAHETVQMANSALTDVKNILSQLNSIDSYDEDRLHELAKKLERLEDEYARAQIYERTKKLQVEKERQVKLMKAYDDDMEALRRDVANILDIKETLPVGCFNPLLLEVP